VSSLPISLPAFSPTEHLRTPIQAYTSYMPQEKWATCTSSDAFSAHIESNTPNWTSFQCLDCTWDGCPSDPFYTTYDFLRHLEDHAHKVRNQWSETKSCTWPGCSSKAIFKSRKSLQTHLENIHINPLRCSEKGCPHQKPFRSNYDLKRHMKTAHYGEQERQYICPYSQREGCHKTFVRKDKWLNHLRSCHDDPSCPLNHCDVGTREGITTQAALVEHIKKCHGHYECGIGSCGLGPRSRFAEFELLKHLEFHHDIQHGTVGAVRNAANLARDRSVNGTHLPEGTWWNDCLSCGEKSAQKEVGACKDNIGRI
jgi:hypothetical protein